VPKVRLSGDLPAARFLHGARDPVGVGAVVEAEPFGLARTGSEHTGAGGRDVDRYLRQVTPLHPFDPALLAVAFHIFA
jgi:hypothetical protein